MIAKDGRVRHPTLNQWGNHLEEGGLTVRYVVVQLVARENHEVRLLVVENCTKKVDGERIGLAGRQRPPVGINGISAHANSSHHVRVGDLNNLELAILPDPKGNTRILGFMWI